MNDDRKKTSRKGDVSDTGDVGDTGDAGESSLVHPPRGSLVQSASASKSGSTAHTADHSKAAGASESVSEGDNVRAWETLSTAELFKAGFFRLRGDECRLPDGRVMPRYYVLEFPDWVNVVPVTDDNKIVLVEQYRHAGGAVCLEIPGGSTHPGSKEDPKQAALRELMEETGYVPDDLRLVGVHSPNPAMQTNRMHTYVAFNCRRLQDPQPDPFEDIRVVTYSIPEVIQFIFDGRINHSIVVASLLYALPTLGFHLPRPARR